jgi:acyl-coenzyme A thioesterase PaaI-like protein
MAGTTLTGRASPGWLRLRANLWPPFIGAGIRVEHIGSDFRSITVAMQQRWYRRGLLGTTSGGSLYAMTDPFFALMVRRSLASDYMVWDKAGSIEYLAAARGRVWARLELLEEDVQQIQRMTANGDKHLHLFSVDVRDDEGMTIARIEKMIYVRRKRGTA